MNKLLILFFVLLFSSFVFSQTSKKSEIKKIDAYCKLVDSFVKKHKRPQMIFADISQTEKEKWRKFASEKVLEKFRKNTETYSIAYNWQRNGKIIQSNFTFFSESGDWAQYVDHYFRTNGTLAKVESDTRTFEGELSVLQDLYFDSKGKLLRKTVQYRELATNKPKKPSKEFLESNGDFVSGVGYFKKTSKLPFAILLKK